MAANFIEVDPTKGARIHQALRAIREGRAILGQELASARGQRTGDGTVEDPFVYAMWAVKKGFIQNDYASPAAAAKAGYDELDSLLSKLSRLAGQGDETGIALDQCCAKFGV